EFEPLTPPAPDPLMGWIGSDDTLQQVRLNFPTKESALAFARKQGWSWTVVEPQRPRLLLKSYAQNFLGPPKQPTDTGRQRRSPALPDPVEKAARASFAPHKSPA